MGGESLRRKDLVINVKKKKKCRAHDKLLLNCLSESAKMIKLWIMNRIKPPHDTRITLKSLFLTLSSVLSSYS